MRWRPFNNVYIISINSGMNLSLHEQNTSKQYKNDLVSNVQGILIFLHNKLINFGRADSALSLPAWSQATFL